MMAAGIRSPAAVRAAAAARGLRLFGDLPAVCNRTLTPHPARLHNNPTQIDSRTRNHDFRVAYPLSWTKTYSTTCSVCNPSSPCNDDDATRRSTTEKGEIDAEAASATMDGSFRAIEFSMNSVVKIFTISLSPCDMFPWQIDCSTKLTGSGFVISGRRILTNAHVVADHKFIQVRKHGSPTKYKAEVQAVGHECDLAILTVDSEEFWKGINFLEFGNIPLLQSSVSVVGYPIGGDNICVTKGVVSRIEQIKYHHVKNKLLAIQIDAAINGGNSGGPALMGEKVVGVAFQGIKSTSAENIGHIIPVPVIQHFISGVEETGGYVGFCSMDIVWQPTENEQLLEHYKMPPGVTGVRVSKINKLSGEASLLKVDDIILSFDGSTIANDGTVRFRNRDRIVFDHLVTMKKPNDTAVVKVLRGGVEHEFNMALRPKQHLVPLHQYDTLPSYYIFAGLIFVPLTQPYYGDNWTYWPRNLYEASRQPMCKDGQQIVIISEVLVDEINIGYDDHLGEQVKKVNGVVVDNLKHLRELVEDGGQESVRFDIGDKHVIILNYSKAQMANSRIVKSYRIQSAMSDDLVEKQSNPDMEFAFAS